MCDEAIQILSISGLLRLQKAQARNDEAELCNKAQYFSNKNVLGIGIDILGAQSMQIKIRQAEERDYSDWIDMRKKLSLFLQRFKLEEFYRWLSQSLFDQFLTCAASRLKNIKKLIKLLAKLNFLCKIGIPKLDKTF